MYVRFLNPPRISPRVMRFHVLDICLGHVASTFQPDFSCLTYLHLRAAVHLVRIYARVMRITFRISPRVIGRPCFGPRSWSCCLSVWPDCSCQILPVLAYFLAFLMELVCGFCGFLSGFLPWNRKFTFWTEVLVMFFRTYNQLMLAVRCLYLRTAIHLWRNHVWFLRISFGFLLGTLTFTFWTGVLVMFVCRYDLHKPVVPYLHLRAFNTCVMYSGRKPSHVHDCSWWLQMFSITRQHWLSESSISCWFW